MSSLDDSWSFRYDANGMRIERVGNTTDYFYVYNCDLLTAYDGAAITYDGCAVISGQQVAPGGIAVGIMRLIQQFPRYSEGESILVPCPNIACIIVDPNPGLARKGVVFPGQLAGKDVDQLSYTAIIKGNPNYMIIILPKSSQGTELSLHHKVFTPKDVKEIPLHRTVSPPLCRHGP